MIKHGDLWLPENETARHWALKWAGWWYLRHHLGCWTAAGVEVDVRRFGETCQYARQDAVGLRREYQYQNHPSLLVEASRLTGHRHNPSKSKWEDCPWLETGVMRHDFRTGKEVLTYQDHSVRLDGKHVEVVTPRPKKDGTVRVRKAGNIRTDVRLIYGLDAKQSRADFLAWKANWQERVAALDYAVIATPVGLLSVADLPPKIGLVEVDPTKFRMGTDYFTKNLALNPGVAAIREPERLGEPRPIADLDWFKLQADCWSGLAHVFEHTIQGWFWPVVQDALAGSSEVNVAD